MKITSPLPLVLASLALSPPIASQVCPTPGTTQLQNDTLPEDPSGLQNIAAVHGLCIGDRAASVFDVSAYPAPVTIDHAGALFGGPTGSAPGGGILRIYDGLTIAADGSVTMGPLVHQSLPLTYPVNTLQMIDLGGLGVQVSSGKFVVSFSLTSNPNEILPGFGCTFGYSANFTTDTTLQPGSPCSTPAGVNLIFDSSQGWWDIPDFKIGSTNWCGPSFNGNWVIRACVVGEPGGPSIEPFSCINPAGSLTTIAGSPLIGTNLILGIDDPIGTSDPGSVAVLFFSTQADPAFPCGTPLPGFGMSGPTGELLVSFLPPNPVLALLGSVQWSTPGNPSPVIVPIPLNPALVGVEVFAQGVLTAPGNSKLTEGLKITFG